MDFLQLQASERDLACRLRRAEQNAKRQSERLKESEAERARLDDRLVVGATAADSKHALLLEVDIYGDVADDARQLVARLEAAAGAFSVLRPEDGADTGFRFDYRKGAQVDTGEYYIFFDVDLLAPDGSVGQWVLQWVLQWEDGRAGDSPGAQHVIATCTDRARRPEDVAEPWVLALGPDEQLASAPPDVDITVSLGRSLEQMHESSHEAVHLMQGLLEHEQAHLQAHLKQTMQLLEVVVGKATGLTEDERQRLVKLREQAQAQAQASA